jgi:enediyne biosynthesis protein CalE5
MKGIAMQTIDQATRGSRRDPAEPRAHLRQMWAGVAGGWESHADYADERGRALTARMLELADPRRGERVLELACGAGGVGLAAAPRVGQDGEVVLSDVVPEMTAIAARRAAALGLGNVRTRDLDLEAIDEPDGRYDVVLCREGLMLVPDPARAAREIARVLRPGGRAAIAVWGPRARNPWLGVVFDAVAAETGAPVPPPGIPGPFSLDDAGRLASVLSGSGLDAVAIEELPTPLRAGSFEEWWARTLALAGPIARLVARLPEAGRASLATRARAAVADYATADGLELPGLTLLASGRRQRTV